MINLLIKIFRKRTRITASIRLLMLINAFYFSYQFFWGMLYFQKPLIEKLSIGEPTVAETKYLALKYLEKCKETREMVKEDRNGVFKVWQPEILKIEILKNQNLLPKNISTKKSTGIIVFKPSLYKKIMNYTGILGYYNPFSAEAQYNANLPSLQIPFTLAHESAHQLGYAREQEANFIGYLIGKNSENIELRYSTEYFVLRSLLNSLRDENPDFVKSVLENYSLGMKRDRLFEKTFLKKHEGVLDVFFNNMNNLFLKTNQQEGSITYSYFVDLLIRYERVSAK